MIGRGDASQHVTQFTKAGTGGYILAFDRSVQTCSAAVTAETAGLIATGATTGDQIIITVRNASGALVDSYVDVTLTC